MGRIWTTEEEALGPRPRNGVHFFNAPASAYDFVLEQFALALLIGAHKNSTWHDGNLVIAANHRQIHLLQAAFYAVRLEVERRKLA